MNGTWSGLPHYTPSDPTFRQKLFFYRQGYDRRSDPQPKLYMKGKRLDAQALPLLSDDANNGMVRPDQPFIVTGINFPPLGCRVFPGIMLAATPGALLELERGYAVNNSSVFVPRSIAFVQLLIITGVTVLSFTFKK